MKKLLFIFIVLTGCGNEYQNQGFVEDVNWSYDSTLSMYSGFKPLDSLLFVRNNKLIMETIHIGKVEKIDKEFWNKFISKLPYLEDSTFSNLEYIEDEGNQYFITGKVELEDITLVLLANNAFNDDMIDRCDLLVLNSIKEPIFFTHLGYVGFNRTPFIPNLISDSRISITQIGERVGDSYEYQNTLSLEFNFTKQTVKCYKYSQERLYWE